MANNINTMQIWCYINYHSNNTKIKSIQSKLFQCLFYTNKALNLGQLVKVLWKHLNSNNTKGSPLCDVSLCPIVQSWGGRTLRHHWGNNNNRCQVATSKGFEQVDSKESEKQLALSTQNQRTT